MTKTGALLIEFCLLFFVPFVASGQTNDEGLAFLQLNFFNPGARALAMGGAFIAMADDATAAVANPAGLTTLNPPRYNPCDHNGNGTDFVDFHDHVLDSIPSSLGRQGEFNPLRRVLLVIPAYTTNATHNAAVTTAYARSCLQHQRKR